MIEKRVHPRHIVAGMGIHARTLFNVEVDILDISMSGASIRSTKRLEIGSEYLFKVTQGDNVISVKGTVVRATLTGSRKVSETETVPVYTAGVEFSEMNTDKAAPLKEFIASKMEELREHTLSGVRLRIDDPGKVVLSHIETCVVKDLSLGGLRIETREEPSGEVPFHLELILPDHDAPVYSTARVAFWKDIPEAPRHYTVGVEFTEMPEEDRARLKSFIESLPGKSPVS
jgi:c-di-GMP-binding flagellar brake protein YcgR